MHCAASWGKWAAWRAKKTRESKQLEQTTTRDKASLSFRLNPLFRYLFLEGWCVILLTVYRHFTATQHLSSSTTQTEYDASSTSQIHPFQPLCHTPFNTQDSCLLGPQWPQWYLFQCSYWAITTIFFKHCSFCIQQSPSLYTYPATFLSGV